MKGPREQPLRVEDSGPWEQPLHMEEGKVAREHSLPVEESNHYLAIMMKNNHYLLITEIVLVNINCLLSVENSDGAGSTHYLWRTAKVPGLMRWTPSSTAKLPSKAALTSGEGCQAVSPLGRVILCCNKSLAPMSCSHRQYWSVPVSTGQSQAQKLMVNVKCTNKWPVSMRNYQFHLMNKRIFYPKKNVLLPKSSVSPY